MLHLITGAASIAQAEAKQSGLIPRSPRTGLPLIPKHPPEPSSRCTEAPPVELLAGIAQFNAGEYWHCHETLEALWRGEPDPIRSLYQGILLIGVGYHHLRRGNYRGARIKWQQGLDRLQPFRPTCMGIDIEAMVAAVRISLAMQPDEASAQSGDPHQIRYTP